MKAFDSKMTAEDYDEQGLDHLSAHSFDEAVVSYTAAIKLDSKNAGYHNNLGVAYIHLNKFNEAVLSLITAINLDSNDSLSHNNLGTAYYKLNQYSEAIISFTKAIKLDLKYPECHYYLGNAYIHLNKFNEAIQTFSKVTKLHPSTSILEGIKKILLDFRKQIIAAGLSEAYERLVNKITLKERNAVKPQDKKVQDDQKNTVDLKMSADDYNEQGLDHYNALEYDEAAVSYTAAIKLDPKNALYHYNLGEAYSHLNKYNEAVVSYTAATNLASNNGWYHYSLGIAYRELSKYNEAIVSYTAAIKLDPKNALYHYNLGYGYINLNKYDEAIVSLTEAVNIDSNNGAYHGGLGDVYYALNKYNEAVVSFIAATNLDSENAAYHYNLGNAYTHLNKYNEAVVSYTAAIKLDPKNALYHNGLGDAYYALNKYNEAVVSYTEAVNLDSKNAQYYKDRGKAYHNLNRYEEAVRDYIDTTKLDPTNFLRLPWDHLLDAAVKLNPNTPVLELISAMLLKYKEQIIAAGFSYSYESLMDSVNKSLGMKISVPNFSDSKDAKTSLTLNSPKSPLSPEQLSALSAMSPVTMNTLAAANPEVMQMLVANGKDTKNAQAEYAIIQKDANLSEYYTFFQKQLSGAIDGIRVVKSGVVTDGRTSIVEKATGFASGNLAAIPGIGAINSAASAAFQRSRNKDNANISTCFPTATHAAAMSELIARYICLNHKDLIDNPTKDVGFFESTKNKAVRAYEYVSGGDLTTPLRTLAADHVENLLEKLSAQPATGAAKLEDVPNFSDLSIDAKKPKTQVVDSKATVVHVGVMLATSASANATRTEVTAMQADLNKVITNVKELTSSANPLLNAATKEAVDIASQVARAAKEATTRLEAECRAAREEDHAKYIKEMDDLKGRLAEESAKNAALLKEQQITVAKLKKLDVIADMLGDIDLGEQAKATASAQDAKKLIITALQNYTTGQSAWHRRIESSVATMRNEQNEIRVTAGVAAVRAEEAAAQSQENKHSIKVLAKKANVDLSPFN